MTRSKAVLGGGVLALALGASACGGQSASPEDSGPVTPYDSGGTVDVPPQTEDANEEFPTVTPEPDGAADAAGDAPDEADALPPGFCPAGSEVEDGSIVPPPRPCDAGVDVSVHVH